MHTGYFIKKEKETCVVIIISAWFSFLQKQRKMNLDLLKRFFPLKIIPHSVFLYPLLWQKQKDIKLHFSAFSGKHFRNVSGLQSWESMMLQNASQASCGSFLWLFPLGSIFIFQQTGLGKGRAYHIFQMLGITSVLHILLIFLRLEQRLS